MDILNEIKHKRSSHLNKIYARDGTVHISSPEMRRGKVLKFIT